MKRHFIDYFILFLKGLAMGAADLVPGVSGGTIAFISGIYEELIESLNNFKFSLIKDLKIHGVKHVWSSINGNFLVALFGGVSVSLISLAKLVSWLIQDYPIALWSFFFGLVLASIVIVLKKIEQWHLKTYISFIGGVLISYWLTKIEFLAGSENLLYLFFSASIAICAMILPGISGAFILILLGTYYTLLEAINSKNLITILVFLMGAIFGILSFSKLLKWLFNNYKNSTLASLTGFMTGALVKIWPWKTVIIYRLNSHGKEVAFMEECVLPFSFEGDSKVSTAISLMALGVFLIIILEKIGTKVKSIE